MNHSTLFKISSIRYLLLLLIVVSFIFSVFFAIFNQPSYSLTRANQEEEICYKSNINDPTKFTECVVGLIEKIADKTDINYSISMLNNIATQSKGMHNYCHTISHSVAKSFYKKYQDNAFTGDYGACSQGYAHGLMQGAADSKDAKMLASAVVKICSDPSAGDKGGCIHGAGHSAYDASLSLDQLLTVCNSIIPQLYQKTDLGSYNRAEKNCIEGWAMQLAVINPQYFTNIISLEQAISPCVKAEGFYKFGCETSFIRQYIANVSNEEGQAIERANQYRTYCSSSDFPNQELVMCNMSLGAAVADIYTHVVSAENEARGLLAGCGNDIETYCARGFANNILSRNSNDLVFARELCGYIKVKSESTKCLEAFKEEALTYNK